MDPSWTSRRFRHGALVHQGAVNDVAAVGTVMFWSGYGHGIVESGPHEVITVAPTTPVTCLECLANPLFTG